MRGMCFGPNTLLENSEDSGTIAGELDYTTFTHYYSGYSMGASVSMDQLFPVGEWGGGASSSWMNIHVNASASISGREQWFKLPSSCKGTFAAA
jgi:hypothetical protein